MTQFPPYAYMALLRAEANQFAPVQRFLADASELARTLNEEVMVYDPLRPQMERLKGMERGQLLMQATQRHAMQSLLRPLVAKLREHSLANKIRWAVDVDPLEF